MIKGKIEHGVPIPSKRRSSSPFYIEVIGFFDQLKVGDSVVFDLREETGYNFSVKLSTLIKIYSIIKEQELIVKYDENYDTARVWRTK